MTETQAPQVETTTDDQRRAVKIREAEIVAAALAWAPANGFGYGVAGALRAIGLGEHLPRETAEVSVHVTGTVTVRCEPDGSWTEQRALRALQDAVYAGRAVVEATEVTETGAPGGEDMPPATA